MDAPEMEDQAAGGEWDLLMVELSEIASWLGVPEPGVRAEIVRVSGIEDGLELAGPDSLVFATEARSLDLAIRSSAGGILASRRIGADAASDARVLWVEDAKLAFAMVAGRLRRALIAGKDQASKAPAIHPRAFVEDDVSIGEGTRVGPGAAIGAGVRIGRECEVLANATVCSGTTLGDRVVVQSGAVLGSTGFGYVRNAETGEYVAFPQQGTLEIEDDVEIGANTTIDRGALGATRIGRGTKIDNLVHIAHNCVIGRDVVIAAQTGISGSTAVGDGAVIGGQVGIGDHAAIGEGVVLGSGSGVLPGKRLKGAGQVFWGIPAQPLKAYLRGLARFRRE